jgi:hypothetical protein
MLALLVILVWVVPVRVDDCRLLCGSLQALHKVAVAVPMIDRVQDGSGHPLTIGISYFSALLMALVAASMIAFTRLRQLNWRVFREGGIKMLLARLCAYALWATLFFFTPGSAGHSRGGLFIHAIQHSRVALMAWLVMFYSASTFILVAMLIEILTRTSKGRDIHANHDR